MGDQTFSARDYFAKLGKTYQGSDRAARRSIQIQKVPTIRNIVVGLPYLSHPTWPMRKQHGLFAASPLNSPSTLRRTTNQTAEVRRLRLPSRAGHVQFPIVRRVQLKPCGKKTRTDANGTGGCQNLKQSGRILVGTSVLRAVLPADTVVIMDFHAWAPRLHRVIPDPDSGGRFPINYCNFLACNRVLSLR